MSDDASLTDFAGSGDGADDSGDADDGPNDPENGAPGPDDAPDSDGDAEADTTETPTFTYTSTPDGAECASCGATVEKRWHAGEGGTAESPDLDPDALVCPDCKEW